MKEVITVQVGQCGNQVGNMFWEDMAEEHGINSRGIFDGSEYQLQGINTHFRENNIPRKFVPRAVLVDLDPMSLHSCRCSAVGGLYRHDNFIFCKSGGENNFAKGYLAEGVDLVDYTMEALRKEAEDCESLSGFSILHALNGGTGSGVGSLLLKNLVDDYSKKIISAYSIYPSNKASETTVEPYNTVLAFPALVKHCNICLTFDNEALYRISENVLKLGKPTYNTLIISYQ